MAWNSPSKQSNIPHSAVTEIFSWCFPNLQWMDLSSSQYQESWNEISHPTCRKPHPPKINFTNNTYFYQPTQCTTYLNCSSTLLSKIECPLLVSCSPPFIVAMLTNYRQSVVSNFPTKVQREVKAEQFRCCPYMPKADSYQRLRKEFVLASTKTFKGCVEEKKMDGPKLMNYTCEPIAKE